MRKSQSTEERADQLAKLGYETRDVSLPTLVRWCIAMFVFIIGTSIFTVGIYVLFVRGEERNDSPQGSVHLRRMPRDPYPLLQDQPVRDIKEYRRLEDQRVRTPAWEDKQAGVVRIPVDAAMNKVLSTLPVLPGAAQEVSEPAPGEYLTPGTGQPVLLEAPAASAPAPVRPASTPATGAPSAGMPAATNGTARVMSGPGTAGNPPAPGQRVEGNPAIPETTHGPSSSGAVPANRPATGAGTAPR